MQLLQREEEGGIASARSCFGAKNRERQVCISTQLLQSEEERGRGGCSSTQATADLRHALLCGEKGAGLPP